MSSSNDTTTGDLGGASEMLRARIQRPGSPVPAHRDDGSHALGYNGSAFDLMAGARGVNRRPAAAMPIDSAERELDPVGGDGDDDATDIDQS